MRVSGDLLARSGWPRGRSGAAAAGVVVLLLCVGLVGGVSSAGASGARPDAGKTPYAAPTPGPEPTPTPTPTPTFEAIAQKKAPASAAVAAAPAPPPRRTPSAGVGGGSESSDVLAYTNAERANAGLGGLGRNGTLVSSACSWAAHMAASGDFSHSSNPGGFRAWGENIASGYGSASAVVAGWMGSSGHRANILNGGYTQMGACYADSASGTRYWVQQFGA